MYISPPFPLPFPGSYWCLYCLNSLASSKIWVIQFLTFSYWLLSVNNMFLRFFHTFNGLRAHFLVAMNNILLSGCTTVIPFTYFPPFFNWFEEDKTCILHFIPNTNDSIGKLLISSIFFICLFLQRYLVGYSPWGRKRVRYELVNKEQEQQCQLYTVVLTLLYRIT